MNFHNILMKFKFLLKILIKKSKFKIYKIYKLVGLNIEF